MFGKKGKKESLSDLMPDENMNPAKLSPARKKSLYDILGLQPDASPEEIKAAYRQAAKDTHPDLHQNDPDAQENFQLVQRAGAILLDPSKRANYDLSDDMNQAEHESHPPWKQKLVALFFEVERQLLVDGVSYKHKNLFGIMATMIDNSTKQELGNLKEIEKFIALQKEIQARLVTEGKVNLFSTMLDGEIRRMERDIDNVHAALDDNKKMLEELKAYKYTYEELPPQPKSDPRTARRPDGAVYLGRIDMGGTGSSW